MNRADGKPVDEPTGYVLWRRERRKGAKWVFHASVETHSEAVALITGNADWHIGTRYEPSFLGTMPAVIPGL